LRHKWIKDNTKDFRAKKPENLKNKGLLHSIYLEDDERLCDAEGNYVNVGESGERHPDKVYFKVSDLAIGFGMERLGDTLTNNRGYIRGKDYVCVTIDKDDNYFITSHP